MSATEFALFVLALLVLACWLPVVVWVTVQCGVYSFLMARRRYNDRHNLEKWNGSRKQKQEG